MPEQSSVNSLYRCSGSIVNTQIRLLEVASSKLRKCGVDLSFSTISFFKVLAEPNRIRALVLCFFSFPRTSGSLAISVSRLMKGAVNKKVMQTYNIVITKRWAKLQYLKFSCTISQYQ